MDFLKFIEEGIPYYHNDWDLNFLLRNCAYLEADEKQEIIKAFHFAKDAHEGAYREGGEPYFSHPFTVANYATYFELSKDVIVACLLHDVVEDTSVSLSQIQDEFGLDIAVLVDGVTKLTNFHNKEEKDAVNVSKLFRSFLHLSPEVFIIKLLDRSHNMSTISKKKRRDKQIENSLETLNIYVPMARNLGCGEIRRALENMSFHALENEKYHKIEQDQKEMIDQAKEETTSLITSLNQALHEKGIDANIRFRMKGLYGIYCALQQNLNYNQIHDLRSIKVTVPTSTDCYRSVEAVHQLIHPTQLHMRDYIAMPKTNGYQALHTTGITSKGTQYQVQIRTEKMMEIAEKGIMVFSIKKKDTVLQELEHFQFYHVLKELDARLPNDLEFYKALKDQILSEHIYITLLDGTKRELPKNSTVLDLVCSLGVEELLHFSTAVKNGRVVSLGEPLQNEDSVFVYSTNKTVYPNRKIVEECKTPYAKVLITGLYPAVK